MGTITVFALKKKPKGKEGTTRARRRRAATNVIRPETAPLAVGLWSNWRNAGRFHYLT